MKGIVFLGVSLTKFSLIMVTNFEPRRQDMMHIVVFPNHWPLAGSWMPKAHCHPQSGRLVTVPSIGSFLRSSYIRLLFSCNLGFPTPDNRSVSSNVPNVSICKSMGKQLVAGPALNSEKRGDRRPLHYSYALSRYFCRRALMLTAPTASMTTRGCSYSHHRCFWRVPLPPWLHPSPQGPGVGSGPCLLVACSSAWVPP